MYQGTKLLEKTLAAVVVERPKQKELEQHLCLDKGYDNPTGREAIEKHQYTPHIRKIGEEKWDENRQKIYPALALGSGTNARLVVKMSSDFGALR